MMLRCVSNLLSTTFFLIAAFSAEALAGSADHGAHQESSAGLPQLDPTWYASQTFWLVLTFAILYMLFSKRVIPDLAKTLEGRRNHIQNDIDMAAQLKKEAEESQEAYEAAMEEARQKASQLYAAADADIKAKTVKELQNFQDRLAKESQVSEARISKTQKEIMLEVDETTVQVAQKAVAKITGLNVKDDLAKKVIEDLHSKPKAA